ncbi:hypothetical protein BDR05DRAFT_1006302 [Suillus weaverae]|nr:hypothetical protein BDR05DRAFT_1006302 [Suillus weaverae]
MDPSFTFHHWSKKKIGMLMKSTATIEDVDGECSFKVSGMALQSCPIAAHYRVALRAINKKFGLYRKIAIHLTDSRNCLAVQLRDTYLSVMDYMHNVRIAFFEDARGSAVPLEAEFRSPALDYYLWLDHKVGGFHDRSRETLEKDHNVTLRSLQNREGEDIIAQRMLSTMHHTNMSLICDGVDWGAYHTTNCHEHDLCGAFQGCVSEEDLQKLLHAVGYSMEGSTVPKESRSPTPVHSMDQPHQTISVTDTMQVNSETLVDPVDTIIDAPLAPSEEAQRSTSRDAVECDTCVTCLDDITISAGSQKSILKPVRTFFTVYIASYRSLQVPTSIRLGLLQAGPSHYGYQGTRVDLSRWFIAHIVVRLRELHGLDEDTPLDDLLQKESVIQATYQEYCELYGMSHFLNATQTIPQERQSMAQFFISAARGVRLSNIHVDCAVQCDSEACVTPVVSENISDDGTVQLDIGHNTASEPHKGDQEICTTNSVLPDDIADGQPTGVDAKCSTGRLHIPSHGAEPMLTLDCDNPCLSAADWTLAAANMSDHQTGVHTSHTTHPSDVLTDTPSDTDTVPLARLRSRHLKNDKPTMTVSKNMRRGKSQPQHDVDSRPSLVRPVIFAATRQRAKKRARFALPPVPNYTIEDLMSASQDNSTPILPSITSQYNTLLCVARRVASALMTESLSEAVSTAASSLMRIELWLEDVALQCKDALEMKDMSLSPLAHNVLLELSTRASQDASSLRSALENDVSGNSKLKYVMTVIQFLCKLRLSQSGADIQYEAGFRVLDTIVKENQRDIPA